MSDPRPAGCTPKEMAVIRRESLATVYNKLNAGIYKAKKDGKKTIIYSPDPYDLSSLPDWQPGKVPEPFQKNPPPRQGRKRREEAEAEL